MLLHLPEKEVSPTGSLKPQSPPGNRPTVRRKKKNEELEKSKIAPNQNQTQRSRILSVDELFRIPQQHVHVRINALQRALVLCLAPFQPDDNLGADPASVR